MRLIKRRDLDVVASGRNKGIASQVAIAECADRPSRRTTMEMASPVSGRIHPTDSGIHNRFGKPNVAPTDAILQELDEAAYES